MDESVILILAKRRLRRHRCGVVWMIAGAEVGKAGAGKGFFKSEDQLNSGDVCANKSSIQERSFETVKEIGLERWGCN